MVAGANFFLLYYFVMAAKAAIHDKYQKKVARLSGNANVAPAWMAAVAAMT
jgi:hypothetical protein